MQSPSTVFTPVYPHSSSSPSPQKNLTGLPRVIKDTTADVFNNIQKWNNQHITGCEIVTEVALLKIEVNDKFSETIDQLLAKLYDIVESLTIYSINLCNLAKQMRKLLKINTSESPVFLSLNLTQLVELIEDISAAYQAEIKAKQHTLQNIGFAKNKSEITFYEVTWIHQRFITDNIRLKLEVLITETGHRQIT